MSETAGMADRDAMASRPLPPRRAGAIHGLRAAFLSGLLRLLAPAFGALSWRDAQRAGAALGGAAAHCARRDRRRALEHIAIAFPELAEPQRAALAQATFRHLGTTLGEVLHLLRHDAATVERHVTVTGWRHIDEARATGRPILIVTGHCGNWELLAALLNIRGLGMSVVARRLDDAPLDRLLVGLRARFGTHSIARGESGAPRALLRALRSGGALGMLIDQDTKVEGVWVPFLGRPAFTPVGAADLASRLGAVPIPAFIERRTDGSHLVRIEPPLALVPDRTGATAQLTQPIEAQIRRVPEQWVWFHRRWRRQPPPPENREDRPGDPRPPERPGRRSQMSRTLLACVGIALAGLVASCGFGGTNPWQRYDLTRQTPEVLRSRSGKSIAPYRTGIGFLGNAEVRDLERVSADQLAFFPQRTSGQVRTLEQAAGTQLAWRVALGDSPFFTATPIGSDSELALEIRIREAGSEDITVLYRQTARTHRPSAPAALEIGLDRWAGKSVELILATAGRHTGNGRSQMLWGSPEIWWRGQPSPGGGPATHAAQPAHSDRTARNENTRPNVLLIGLDTVRFDAVGSRPGGGSLTPSIDRFARQADVWLDAYSTFNVTNPSFASIFTGLYGKNHGVYDLATPLPRGHTTLAEHFSAADYRTFAVISASHLGDHNSGLGQGFDSVVRAEHHFAAEAAVAETVEWISAGDTQRPFFAWVHLFDAHTPHTPPEPYALGLRTAGPAGLPPVTAWTPFRTPGPRAFDEMVLGGQTDLYYGEMAYLDRQIGRLLDFLESSGTLEHTLVVVVSDHGENLGEHGIRYRHLGLFETTTHVPLMVRWPGKPRAGRRIAGLVQTLDLFPTMLAACGLRVPEQDGEDLRLLTGPGRAGRRAVFSEHSGKTGAAVRTTEYSYATQLEDANGNRTSKLPEIAFYDLLRDPAETENLAGRGQPSEAALAGMLASWNRERLLTAEVGPAQTLSEEERAKLRALGYF